MVYKKINKLNFKTIKKPSDKVKKTKIIKKNPKIISRDTIKKKLIKSKNNKLTSKINLNDVNYDYFINNFGNVDIEFTTYNKGLLNNKNKYKIFSVSYFVIENSEDLQKSKKYLKSMNRLIKTVKENLPDYKFRIYCDKPAFENVKHYINDSRIEIFVYNIPYFLTNKEKGYHKGYIGTVIRYFPLFNIPEHKCDLAVCFDIDSILQYKLQELIKKKLPKIPFLFFSHSCYHVGSRFLDIGRVDFPIMGGFVCANLSKLTFPKYLLDEFFNEYLLKNNLHYETYIKLFTQYENPDKLPYPEEKKERPHIKDLNISKFIYGVDEYFLNNQIRRYIMFKNINIYYYTFVSQLKETFKRLIKDLYYTDNLELNIQFYKLFQKYIDILPFDVKQNQIDLNNTNITQLFQNNYYIFKAFSKYQSLKYNIQYNINKKIHKINNQILNLIKKNYNKLNYNINPEGYSCVSNGFKADYNKSIIKSVKYNKYNTNFMPPKLKLLTDNELKSLNIDIKKLQDYVKSKDFINFKK
jgi:hypothetical protein